MKPQVVCLPGSVAPAANRYAPLRAAIGDRAALHLKDLELYRTDTPPEDYSIEMELAAVDQFATLLGLDRFHMIGYSGGGMISLAYAGTRPERLLSLGLFEAARVPGQLTPAERSFFDQLNDKLSGLRGPDFMSAFVREQVKSGAVLPPPPPPNPEMRKRPAGIAAMLRVFESYRFDRDLLRSGTFPVFYAYGDLSHEEQALKAGVLAQLFPDIHVRRFDGIHHFVAPEEIYTPKHTQFFAGHVGAYPTQRALKKSGGRERRGRAHRLPCQSAPDRGRRRSLRRGRHLLGGQQSGVIDR